jgi:hypothetical protein
VNESQLLSVALSTVPTMVVVMIGILINNARMGDLRSDLTARISDLKDVLLADMRKNHSELLLKFNELNRRIGSMG